MNGNFLDELGEAVARRAGAYGPARIDLLRQRIESAGDLDVKPEAILGMQVMSMFLFPASALFILWKTHVADFLFGGPHTAVFAAGLMVFGFLFPSINLDEKVAKRQQKIIVQIPDMMDLLAVCVEAGMDFLSALRVVVKNQDSGPLRDEFDRFLKKLELGVPRVDALHEMARRIDLPDMYSVSAVLVQATKLGSPLGPILKTQAELLRTRRGLRAEKAAAEASVKVMMPLALCIFPAVFIAILGPVVLEIMDKVRL